MTLIKELLDFHKKWLDYCESCSDVPEAVASAKESRKEIKRLEKLLEQGFVHDPLATEENKDN